MINFELREIVKELEDAKRQELITIAYMNDEDDLEFMYFKDKQQAKETYEDITEEGVDAIIVKEFKGMQSLLELFEGYSDEEVEKGLIC